MSDSDDIKSVENMRWYIIHAYSGFENYVVRAINERVKIAGLESFFGDI